jgi:putative hemolysin
MRFLFNYSKDTLTLSGIFLALFTVLALLHACEIAITTLYPWKVREFAEEEEKSGKSGTFKVLNEDITRVLTTILVTSTASSIFATTLFTHLVASMFGARGERYGALALTGLTLFFVELLPKSIGVTNAEAVARVMVPPVNIISTVVSPLGISLSWLAKKTLLMLGLKDKGDGSSISDSQLRLIVTGARDSGTIDYGEQEMIQGVLDLQTRRVKEIMKPRVEMIAVPKTMSVADVLGVVRESGYSRIPVYDGEIDNIVGIILAKSVLDFFVKGVLIDEDVSKPIKETNGAKNDPVEDDETEARPLTGFELASRMQTPIEDAGLIEACYFVPETANGWSVLQEMRRRRVHMAIIVDEFGGTEGLVSLEDIVEEVVGEIYDEDDVSEPMCSISSFFSCVLTPFHRRRTPSTSQKIRSHSRMMGLSSSAVTLIWRIAMLFLA